VNAYLPFVVAGIISGAVYGLAALGLVVTYSTTGVFNFAHGAIGMVAAYGFYSMRLAGVPTWLALVLAVFALGPVIGLVIDRVLFSRLTDAPPSTYIVASLGLLVALQGLVVVIYGPIARRPANIFPTDTFRLPGVNVGYDQAATLAVAALAVVLVVAFLRRTHLGLQMRAQVDAPVMTGLVGANQRRITGASWMLGCSLAALAAILLVPAIGLDAATLTLLVVQAFGAAVVGRLRSLPLTFLGALAIGVLTAISSKFVAEKLLTPGFPSSVPFLVLFLVLVVSRRGWFVEAARDRKRDAAPRTARPRPAIVAAALAGLVVLPFVVSNSRLFTATATIVYLLIFASLGLAVGRARQLALCHAVYVAFGATTMAHLLNLHVPYVAALVITGLALVPLGALVAIPAIRLSGVFLALATFGFGVLAQSLLFSSRVGFGGVGQVTLARPSLFGISLAGDKAFYFFCLVVVGLGVTAIVVLSHTRLGLLTTALADSSTGFESIGLRPTTTSVLVFCASAFLAAVAGGLLGSLFHTVSLVSFDYFQSLIWVTVLVAAGAASLGGAALAAVLLVALPGLVHSRALTDYQPIIFGLGAILLAQRQNGLIGLLGSTRFDGLARRSAWRLDSSPVRERLAN
jgi:branched-subunit amino acid ABC-type transport system permease component